jgi:hypothetical protein
MRLIAAMAAMAGFFPTNVKKCQRKINTYRGWKVPAIAAIAARVPLPLDCTRVIITTFEKQSRPHCQGVVTGRGSRPASLHTGNYNRDMSSGIDELRVLSGITCGHGSSPASLHAGHSQRVIPLGCGVKTCSTF